MPLLDVVRVFTGDGDAHGNPLGVFLRGAEVPPAARQRIARRLGFSETVFVDDAAAGVIEIYTPAAALPFAGHPVVGTAWLLAEAAADGAGDLLPALPAALHPPAGAVPVRRDADGTTWLAAPPAWAPPMELWRYNDPAVLAALPGAPRDDRFIYAWAWLDEPAGVVCARGFAPHLGVPEDEATGSAAVRLGAVLARPLRIEQGAGSVLLVRPPAERGGAVEVGGRVVRDGRREEPL